MRVAVMGASGYAGSEVLRLAGSHPDLDVVLATAATNVGQRVGTHTPALAALYPTMVYGAHDDVATTDLDAVFLALPHGASVSYVADLVDRGVLVIDLGADFRLSDAANYEQWYGFTHAAPELLARAVYALVERHRPELGGGRLLAIPGCYPTATALAAGPFADAGWLTHETVIVNALSGASGAGRATNDRLHFSRLVGNAEPYGLLQHRHTPEMEAELGRTVLFTPHLVPVARGMLATVYARPAAQPNTDDALALLRECYAHEPFVVVSDEPPTLKDPLGSNLAFVSARVDPRTGWLIAMCSIDNLVKGAAGQAIQAFNVATGREETMGLPRAGVTP
jgi:N-acetyl-gamma-glutamyl-phosphate reductase